MPAKVLIPDGVEVVQPDLGITDEVVRDAASSEPTPPAFVQDAIEAALLALTAAVEERAQYARSDLDSRVSWDPAMRSERVVMLADSIKQLAGVWQW
jgi:hypothetical protein